MRERWMVMAAVFLAASAACAPRERSERSMRLYSNSYSFLIAASVTPPYAREAILYKVIIRDRKNRQPIETGEGQIYANDSSQASTWDGFRKGTELGTYYGKLNFITAGKWAIAIRFRRDSLHKLETVEWYQDVRNERDAAIP